jgi:hypothetical protein
MAEKTPVRLANLMHRSAELVAVRAFVTRRCERKKTTPTIIKSPSKLHGPTASAFPGLATLKNPMSETGKLQQVIPHISLAPRNLWYKISQSAKGLRSLT